MGWHQPLQLLAIEGRRAVRQAVVQSHSRVPLLRRIS
jgi:hypothetical protein